MTRLHQISCSYKEHGEPVSKYIVHGRGIFFFPIFIACLERMAHNLENSDRKIPNVVLV